MNESINRLCDMLLAWTQKFYEPEVIAETGHVMSSEVYDRAVSVIGIVVPCGLFLFALAAVVVLLTGFGCLFKRGGK